MILQVDTPVVTPPRVFILTLSETEAGALRSVMAAIGNNNISPGPVSKVVYEVWNLLGGYGLQHTQDVFVGGRMPVVQAGK